VPNHWSGKQPPFEDVVLRVIGNADLVALIKGGVVDYAAEGLTGRQYDALAAAGFPVLHGETPSILRLAMAMDKEPFTDARIRQAMLYAIPHDRILKTALAGRGKRQICLYNARIRPASTTSTSTSSISPRQGTAEGGRQAQLLVRFLVFDGAALQQRHRHHHRRFAEVDRVTANLKPTPRCSCWMPFAHASTARSEHERHAAERGRDLAERPFDLDQPRPGDQTATGGVTNWARFSDPEVDELHLKYRNSSDVEGRKAAYKKIQEKAAEAAATVNPLILIGRTIVVSPKITGVTFSQDPYARYVYLRPK